MFEQRSMERRIRVWAVTEASSDEVTISVHGLRGGSTTRALMTVIDSMGFDGECDFVHVPTHFRSKTNFGFAFVNFRSSSAATRFVKLVAFGGLSGFAAGPLRASPSKKQGLAECLLTWCRSHSRSVRSAEVFPFVRPLHATMLVNPYLKIPPSGPRVTDIPMPAFASRSGGRAD